MVCIEVEFGMCSRNLMLLVWMCNSLKQVMLIFFLLWLICLSGLRYVDLFQFEGSDSSIDCCQPGHKHVAISINSRVI